eukprot:COSAG02_NODE_3401_length_6805_cov_70.980763_1_plen_40_part_10
MNYGARHLHASSETRAWRLRAAAAAGARAAAARRRGGRSA